MTTKTPMSPSEFSARLAALGLSQSAFARCAGLKQVSISRYMSGASPVPDGLAQFVRVLESRVRECVRLEAKALRERGTTRHQMVDGWLLDGALVVEYGVDMTQIVDALHLVIAGRAYGEVDGDGMARGEVLG